MDGPRFDALLKTFSLAPSRRRVLKGLAAPPPTGPPPVGEGGASVGASRTRARTSRKSLGA